MFRIMYLFLFSFIVFNHVSSQVLLRPQIGVNFANLTYQSVHGSIKGSTGFNIGADLQIGDPFYVQPGIHISTTKLKIDNFGGIRISEVNVPIMLGFKLFNAELPVDWGIRLFAGPELAFNVYEKIDNVFTDISRDDIRNFQAAGIIGAGVDFSILFLDIGYKFGISDYIRTESANTAVDYFFASAGINMGF